MSGSGPCSPASSGTCTASSRDVEPTIAEWEQAIDFLTATGQKCNDVRQEFILLSDVLGVSMLVETINDEAAGATESTVLGPVHVVESPVRALGENIDLVGEGEPCVVTGQGGLGGRDTAAGRGAGCLAGQRQGLLRRPAAGRAASRQRPRAVHRRRRGEFWFRTVMPSYYPIPTDGPVGDLLMATRRHPYRPAHIHFIVAAPTATAR